MFNNRLLMLFNRLTPGSLAWMKQYYLLYDSFSIAKAAGLVNGTLADVGGARTVTDTESKLSVASGKLAISSGKAAPAFTDPALNYKAFTRVSGRALLCTRTKVNSRFLFGWSGVTPVGANPSADNIHGYSPYGTLVAIRGADLGALLSVGVFDNTQYYDVCTVLRASGAFYFFKGGAFTNWTLLYLTNTSSDTPLYPFKSVYDSSLGTDNIRIPKRLWLPSPLASDGFSTALTDGLATAEGIAGGLGSGGAGLTWNARVGTWQTAGGVSNATALDGAIAIRTVDISTPDTIHTCTITKGTTGCGIVLRYVDTDNYIYANTDGTNAYLTKRVAGSETNVITAAITYAAGKEIRVIAEGTAFRLFYNNLAVGAVSTISDAGLQAGTEIGLYATDVDSTYDNMYTFARGTSNEHAALDSL